MSRTDPSTAATVSTGDKNRLKASSGMKSSRQREAARNPNIGVATASNPSHYDSYPAPEDSVASTLLRYIQNLQQNSCIARPTTWSSIINHLSYRKNSQLTPYTEHIWNTIQCNHYVPVATLDQLETQLRNRLFLPALISPLSELGMEIMDQTSWPGKPLLNLLPSILSPSSENLEVQDHQQPTLNTFTISKTCKTVLNRFKKPLSNRGPA